METAHSLSATRPPDALQRVAPRCSSSDPKRCSPSNCAIWSAMGLSIERCTPFVPPKVDYSLTGYGQTLKPLLRLICNWGIGHRARAANRPRKSRHHPGREFHGSKATLADKLRENVDRSDSQGHPDYDSPFGSKPDPIRPIRFIRGSVSSAPAIGELSGRATCSRGCLSLAI